jgi:hypothetical protein
MPTLTSDIASWDVDLLTPDIPFTPQDGIATEAQREDPAWMDCVDALLKVWYESATPDDAQPNRGAIKAALSWVTFLRKRFPHDPPTCIIPEPAGGIIVERRITLADGRDCLCEFTFYNNGEAERTDYVDGRIKQMNSIPLRPCDEYV